MKFQASPVADPLAQLNFQQLERLLGNGPVDSGWIPVDSGVNANLLWAHNLNISISNLPLCRVNGWFTPDNPPSIGVYPLSLRGMKADKPLTTSQGYENPAWMRLTPNALEYGIYAAMPAYMFYDPVAVGWQSWNTGFYRFQLWTP